MPDGCVGAVFVVAAGEFVNQLSGGFKLAAGIAQIGAHAQAVAKLFGGAGA